MTIDRTAPNPFFDHPVLNSPYAWPRRRVSFITPIPKPKKHKQKAGQAAFVFDEGQGLSTAERLELSKGDEVMKVFRVTDD